MGDPVTDDAVTFQVGETHVWCGRCGSRTEKEAGECWHCHQSFTPTAVAEVTKVDRERGEITIGSKG